MKDIIQLVKYLYYNRNGDCDHEPLHKTESGYCPVCRDEIPLERQLRLLEVLGKIKRIKK